MTATGTDDAGRETGECEYLPGEDGGYWNYILKADYNKEGTGALDLTKYYGLLPHGKSAYVYDAEAGTVVFTSGIVSITAKLLREGDYSYGSSTLSVPGSAFDFALPGRRRRGPTLDRLRPVRRRAAQLRDALQQAGGSRRMIR